MSNRKQTFRLRNYSFRNILIISSGVTLGLFAFLTLVPPTNPNQAALATIDPEIYDLTVTATDATIDVSSVGGVSVAKSTVTSTTLSPAGYKLYISTDSDSNTAFLNGDSSNIEDYKKIVATAGTFASPAALTADSSASWGYAIAGLNNFDSSYESASNSSKFAAVPGADEPQLIHTHTGASADGSELDVYFGAKATTTIAAGNYSTSIVFSSISDATSETEEEAEVTDGGVVEGGYENATFAVKTSLKSSLMSFTPSDINVTVANKACTDIIITEQAPLSVTAKMPANLSVGEYDVVVSIPRIGKTYTATKAVKVVAPAPKTAKAILGSNGNLNFIYDNKAYTVGETYTDNLGETTIDHVYSVATDNWSSGWMDNNGIISANFEESFYDFEPKSTRMWFKDDKNLAKVTNAQNLNTSKVTNMDYMFEYAGYNVRSSWILEGLSEWDTSLVTHMYWMFRSAGRNAEVWNIGNIGGWDVGSVTSMCEMFSNAGTNSATMWFLGDLSNWNVGLVTDMEDMFYNAGEYATDWNIGDLSNWDVSSVTNMERMFYNAGYKASIWSLGNLYDWDVSNVIDMKEAFSGAGEYATDWNIGDLSNWDVSSVTDMSSMFSCAGRNADSWSIGDLGGWNVSSVTDMSSMFNNAGHNASMWSIGNTDNWDTGRVTSMSYMFNEAGYSATTWTLNVANWDTSSVTNMAGMFQKAGYNAENWSIDLSGWNVGSVTSMNNMFYWAGYNSKNWTAGNLDEWIASSVTNVANMFNSAGYKATTWSVGSFSKFSAGSIINMSYMFYNAGHNAETWVMDLSNWNVGLVTTMQAMFSSAGSMATTWFIGNLDNWNVSSVMTMSGMFSSAGRNATTWSLGNLDNWKVDSVTSMYSMFGGAGYEATSWSIGDLSNWNVGLVTDMEDMFYNAGYSSMTWSIGNIGGWNVGSVTDMDTMFQGAGHNAIYSLDLSGWNVNSTVSHRLFNYQVESKVIPPVWTN